MTKSATMAPPASKAPLRLKAEDETDLEVLSAAVQDSVLRRADIDYDPKRRRLTLGLRRYQWERDPGTRDQDRRDQGRALGARAAAPGRRVAAALDVSGVLSLRSRGVGEANAVLSLLAVRFEAGAEPPAGAVCLMFAGGGAIRAEVECLDVWLADVSRPWLATGRPSHPLDED